MAFDRKTGRRVWEHTVREEVPHEGSHRDASLASGSPVTDGEHLVANFGSRGLYCFDAQGKLIWEKNLGDMRTRHGFGEGGSPALHGNTLVVNWDHEGESFIVALDKRTGRELWRKPRDEVTSWSTPLVVEQQGRPQAVVTATRRVRAYDLANGEVVWECGGLGANCIPSPVAGFGMIYAMSGYRDKALLAIRYADAKGDLTGSEAVVWSRDEGTPYVPSPLLHGDRLYYLDKNSALLSCFDAKTGVAHYTKQRLEKINGVYASPVGVGQRLYVAGRDGTTYVLKNASEFEVLAVNELEDGFDASPAIAGDELYLRGRKYLYCIARD